jgi:hypothetical protein
MATKVCNPVFFRLSGWSLTNVMVVKCDTKLGVGIGAVLMKAWSSQENASSASSTMIKSCFLGATASANQETRRSTLSGTYSMDSGL